MVILSHCDVKQSLTYHKGPPETENLYGNGFLQGGHSFITVMVDLTLRFLPREVPLKKCYLEQTQDLMFTSWSEHNYTSF